MNHDFHNIKILEHQGTFNLLARGERYGQLWLLKGLKPEFAQKKLYRDLLRKEFDIAIQLHHPNIVGMVSMERIEALGSLCIVEEWIDGETLLQWLSCNHTVEEKLNVLRQLLTAIAHCHNHDVIHRDLKPSNIMITREDNQVKIIDFGLSDTNRYSSLKAAAGTINYVAPEVLEKDGETTVQADIYSLGMIMKDMHLPKRYNAVIDKAVATHRNERFGSVGQLQDAIEMASYRSKQKKWLAVAAGAALLLCLAAFWGGYKLNIRLPLGQQSSTSYQDVDYGQHSSDSLALATDTALTTIIIADKGLSLYYPKPGVAVAVSPISESDAVDLGLSVLWAPCNVGAERTMGRLMPGAFLRNLAHNPYQTLNDESDYFRDYFYNTTLSFEGTIHDAAHMLWRGKWRLPLKSEFQELIDKCKWEYVEPPGDLPGFLIIGPSGKSLFLPMGGFRYDTHYFSVGTKGFYWTASRAKAGEDPSDWAITFDNYMISINVFSNLNAFLVRPVLDKKPHKINEFYNHLPE